MNKIFDSTLEHKKTVVAVFCVIFIACAVLAIFVPVNYKLESYLPADAESTKALQIMENEFSDTVPNARVAVFNVEISQAIEYKKEIENIDGVESVLWLDDAADLIVPVETLDKTMVETYYKDKNAVFSVTVKEGTESKTVKQIRELIGDNGAVSGEAALNANSQDMTVFESLKAFAFLIPLIIIILLISTSSWIEPVLFLAAIGVAVVINMGTNIFFGQVSFITQSISPILQMAVSLDYAIFLLRAFSEFRQTHEPKEAMRLAQRRALPAVAASAMTTLLGFLALCFMRFGIGSDLGINLVKGVSLSFISVMIFLPPLTLCCIKLLDKTRHKEFKPKLGGISKFVIKIRIPIMILMLALIIPSFIVQDHNKFTYGLGALETSSRAGQDEIKINETFGRSVPTVVLVPKGDTGREDELCKKLGDMQAVTSVVSYTTAVGSQIPQDFLDSAVTKNFYSDNYSRIILYADTETEGDEAFTLVENTRSLASEYYGDKALTLGESVSLYDIKNVVNADSTFINILAIVLIGLVVLFTFKSLSLPLILLLTIEGAIWINLAITYFSGSPLCYIGFLVISTVQLGATVDYAILFTDNYLRYRKDNKPKDAAQKTLVHTMPAIIISAAILSLAGFIVGLVSTNDVVSQLGYLLGRGALLSAASVLLFLPALTSISDKFVGVTTLKRRDDK
ncbi:MAG: RND transporter [Clostridiales bacterium]|nr:MAG: RND transporter [Clostridiales bacterium]